MSGYASLGIGLICLLAFAVLLYHGMSDEAIVPRQAFALAGLMAICASRFLIDWARWDREREERKLEGK